MHLPPGKDLPTVRSKTLKGLSQSTFPFFQNLVLTMLMKSGGSSIQQVRNDLAEAQLTYLTLLQQGNYPPGKQPLKEDTRVQALQAQVKSLTDKVGSLSRDPEATSTTGSGPSTGNNHGSNSNTQAKRLAYKDRDPNGKAVNGLCWRTMSRGVVVTMGIVVLVLQEYVRLVCWAACLVK